MPRPKRTAAEIEAMQERILDSAETILHEEGPQRLSIRAIADHVGVSHMVLYSYFDSHEALISALRKRKRRRNQTRHKEILNKAKTGEVRIVMNDVLQNYFTFAHKNPRLFRFLWDPRPESSSHDCKYTDKGKHHSKFIHREVHLLSEIIHLGIEKNEFIERDPDIAAYLIVGIINTPILMDKFFNAVDEKTLETLETEALKTCMYYLTGQEM